MAAIATEAIEAQRRQIEERKRRLAADPVYFSRKCLGFTPWSVVDGCDGFGQVDVMRAVAEFDYVAVRSGHKIGKSRLAAALAIWWGVTRPSAHVIMTAPTFDQVENPLWSELRDLYENSPVKLADTSPALDPGTGWRLGGKRIIRGRTTAAGKPEAMAGKSGHQLFFIVDEASGYPEPLFRALFGNLAGGGKILLLSNPTQTSGTFYNAFHERAHLWRTLHVRSTDTPNFHGGRVPGIATPEWLARQVEDWGEGSEAYLVRALGEFPSASSDAVIALALVEAAKKRAAKDAFANATERLNFGVDVGRGGDDTVIQPRRGYILGPLDAFNGSQSEDGPTVAGRVMMRVRDHRKPGAKPERPVVKVDTIGYGASAFDALKPFSVGANAEIELVGVNSSTKSDDESRYHNLRSQLHFAVRDWLKDGGALPDDGKLCGELVAAKWKPDPRGRCLVEPKDEIKKRLGRSPDRADALSLAVYDKVVKKGATGGGFFAGPAWEDRPIG